MLHDTINTGQLWADVAELSGLVLNTRRSLHDALWREISDLAGRSQETMDAVTDRLIGETQELCGLEQRIKEEIRRQLDAMVSHCTCLVGNCQGLIDEHNAKIQKREANRQAQARRRARQQGAIEGRLSAQAPPVVSAPSPDKVAGLYLRIGTEGDQLALGQFTPDMWSVDSPTGLFWSIAPTVFTRAVVAAYSSGPPESSPATSVYLNVTIPLQDADAAEVVSGLGFQPNDYNLLSAEDAYYQAVDNWGQVTVDNLYDQRGMVTYARRPSDVPTLRVAVQQPAPNGLLHPVSPPGPATVAVGPAVERFAAREIVPPDIIGPIDRGAIIILVDKLIRLGLVRPEDRGRAEQELLIPGEQFPGELPAGPEVGRPGGEQPLVPPADRPVVADVERPAVLPVCPDWLRALLGLGGLDCSPGPCDVVNAICRAFRVPENTIPPCVSIDEFIAFVTHRR